MFVRRKKRKFQKIIQQTMKNRFILLLSAVMACAMPAAAEIFKAETFTLDNGLQCVVVENHKAPLVKHMLWYKVGSVDEEYGKGGSAHLLEHLMFRGTKRAAGNEFNRMMEKNGVESNAFTSHEVTVYHEFADVAKLEILMALEADRMQNLAFSAEDYAAEQQIVLQERKQRVENNPSAPFGERFNKILWGNLPYGHPVTGLSDEIMALTYDDIREFYQKFYAPNNAVLVISGDVDAAMVKPLVQKYYGELEKRAIARSEIPVNQEVFTETLKMALPDIQTVKMVQKSLLPPVAELGEAVYDYAVLAQYLGGGETSALYKELVINQKTAVGVSADYHFVTKSNTVFAVTMIPTENDETQTDAAWESLAAAQDEAVRNLTAAKLEQIKRKILADLVYMNDNPEDAAYWIGYMLAMGFSLDDVQNYEENIQKVSLNGVKKAYATLKSAPIVRGTLLPQKNNAAGKGK